MSRLIILLLSFLTSSCEAQNVPVARELREAFMHPIYDQRNIQVAPENKTLTVDKMKYFLGESSIVSYRNPNNIPFQYPDQICIFNASTTDYKPLPYYYNYYCPQPYFFYGYLNQIQGSIVIRLNQGIGNLKAVLIISGKNESAAVSDVFEVVAEVKELTVEKPKYFLGEYANVSYSSPNKIPFQYSDKVCFFKANSTNYNAYNCTQSNLLPVYSTQTQGSTLLRITQGAGNFVAVLFVTGLNDAAAVSNVFEVVADNKTLTLDKSNYFLGESATINYSSQNKIPFQYTDQVCIFAANVTDYKPYYSYNYYCYYLTFLYGYSNQTQGSIFIRLNQGIGKLKAVLFIGGFNEAAAVSTVFEVTAEVKELTVERPKYFLGEYANVSYSSPNKIPFQYSDKVCFFKANSTNYNAYNCTQSNLLPSYSNQAQGSTLLRITQGAGNFVAVLFVTGLNDAAAVSNVFEVVADNKTLTLDKSNYFLGESATINYSSQNKIPFQYTDQVCIFAANVTDYKPYYYNYFCPQPYFLDGYANQTQGSIFIRLNQGIGKLKAVLFIGGFNEAAAVSTVFEVTAEVKELTVERPKYFLGEYANVSYSSPNKIPFEYPDQVCIFAANVTDYKPYYSYNYFCSQPYFLYGYANQIQGSIFIRLNQGIGKFKVVLFVTGLNDAAAVSNVFEVVAENKTLTLDKSNYFLGESATINYSSPNKIPFQYPDQVCIFAANVTDYKPYYSYNYYCYYLTFLYGYSNQTQGSIFTRLSQGIGKFKAVLLIGGVNEAAAVSAVFEVVAESKILKLDKPKYFLGEYANVSYSSPNNITFQYSDKVCFFKANSTNYNAYNCTQSTGNLLPVYPNQTQGSTLLRITQGAGNFVAVLFVTGLNDAAAVSNVFEVVADNKTLTLDKSNYFLGESATINYSSQNKIPFQYTDQVCIFAANVTDYKPYYYNYFCPQPYFLDGYANQTQGSIFIRLNQGIGKLKAVLFIGGFNEAVAVSTGFEVTAEVKELTVERPKYFLGEYANVSYSSPNKIPFEYPDQVCIFAANVTDYKPYYSYNYYCYYLTFLYGYSNQTQGSKFIRLSQGIGKFKVVLFVTGLNDAAAVSNVFEVAAENKTLTLDKPKYFLGEYANVSYSSPNNITFQYPDKVCIFNANISDFQAYNCGTSSYFLSGYSNETLGSTFIRMNKGVGKFKAVLFIAGVNEAAAVTSVFEVVSENKTLTVDKLNYFLGQSVNVTFSSPNKIPFEYPDQVCIFAANVTDYKPYYSYNYYCYYLTFLYGYSNQTQGSKFIRLCQGIGKFKAVLFIGGVNEAATVSTVFEVAAENKTLILDKPKYFLGEYANVSYSSPNNITFQYPDKVCIFNANISDFQAYNCGTSSYFLSGYSNETLGSTFIRMIKGVGKFKAVLFIAGVNEAAAVTSVFEVVSENKTLTVDKLNYFLGESVNVTFSSPNMIPFEYPDQVCIFAANVTDYKPYYSYYYCYYLYFLYGYSNQTQGSKFIPLGQGIGKFKAVLFIGGVNEAAAVSNVFDVIQPFNNGTRIPTKMPRKAPIMVPTKASTKAPTKVPLKLSTRTPTKIPTKMPTQILSKAPTRSPSKLPTKSPTKIPSNVPTRSPTKIPTKSPTNMPNKVPTKSPSKLPTKSPTKIPSKVPTKSPTNMPNKVPTKSPSKLPTKSPTKIPSKVPTKIATKSPTMIPNKVPNSFVTKIPTKAPAKAPSTIPTKVPTKAPLKVPIMTPVAPVKVPTTILVPIPTKVPLAAPVTVSPTTTPVEPPTSCGLFGLNFFCLPRGGRCGFFRRLFNIGGC